ncbi:MAG TPA: hypothetical protein VF374_08505 [Thermoplasmata archaeon]|jgi:hypothetical protein
METNKDFAVLVGRAFLYELDAGNKDAALAFGRAFLLALGMKSPEDRQRGHMANGRQHGEFALAEN